jgi:hypothetical protein
MMIRETRRKGSLWISCQRIPINILKGIRVTPKEKEERRRELHRLACQRYIARHPQRRLESSRKYYATHKAQHNKLTRRWQKEHPELAAQYSRASHKRNHAYYRQWFLKNKKRLYALDKERRKGCPGKLKCRGAVAKALRKGLLVKQPCEVCGNTRSQAHHDDYRKPLNVRWLCSAHHGELHRKYA